MLDVMQNLRPNGCKTSIVKVGGQDFVRMYSEQVCDIPPPRARRSTARP